VVTDDAPLLDEVQSMYERVWTGGECAGCKLRDDCPGPLSELARDADRAARAPATIAGPAQAPGTANPARRRGRAARRSRRA